METLIHFLSDIDSKKPQKWFRTIAEKLMCNYVIQKGKQQYKIVEIEFYFYSREHQDVITYPRKMEAGRWFFHSSGVDLTFKSNGIEHLKDDKYKIDDNAYFGGILIRGLYKFDDKNSEYIFGPQRCVNELWDNFNAFDEIGEYPILKEYETGKRFHSNLKRCKRHINIKDDKRRHDKICEWAKKIALDWGEHQISAYDKGLLNENYRYFNLPDYEDSTLTKIPSHARPKKETLIP